MKAVLPILICSAITGALGYYFGHITLPPEGAPIASTATSMEPTSPQPSVFETAPPAPAETAPPAPAETASPAPVEPASEPEAAPAPVAATATSDTAEPTESEFANRAAKPIQTLTDTQGREMQASIVKVLDTEVKIRRSDGLETTIPLNMLSPEDVAFCNYLKEQQEPEPVKAPDSSDAFDWDAYFNS